MPRRSHPWIAVLAWACVYGAISLPFTLAAAVFCLALFHLFIRAALRIVDLVGIEDPAAIAVVLGVMFGAFLAVYLGELPGLMAAVGRTHGRATAWITRKAARV